MVYSYHSQETGVSWFGKKEKGGKGCDKKNKKKTKTPPQNPTPNPHPKTKTPKNPQKKKPKKRPGLLRKICVTAKVLLGADGRAPDLRGIC